MVQNTGAFTKAVIWQDGDGDCSIGEPALLVSVYDGIFTIKQGAGEVNINYETIPEMIRLLRDIRKERLVEAPDA